MTELALGLAHIRSGLLRELRFWLPSGGLKRYNANMKIIVDNLALRYRDEGKGPVVVLLHGWGQDLTTFDALAGSLSEQFRVIRVDLPGFGQSQRPNSVWGVLQYVKVVRNLLNKLNIEQPFGLIGHSFGGRIAIKASATAIINPKKLICIDSAGINSSNSLRNLSFKFVAKAGKWALALPILAPLRKPLRRKLYAAAGATDYLDAGPMRQIFLKTIKEDLRDEAKKIRIPTLFVWGEDDGVTPLWEAREMSNRIQASVVRVVKDAGHFSYIDQPQKVTKLIVDFLS